MSIWVFSLWTGLTSTGAATLCTFLADWTVNRTVAKVDVTAMGDSNLVYVAGMPDASGDFSGWYDNATAQMYAATTDGLPRNFYLYEDAVNNPTNYWFGTILPDMAVAAGVAAAASVKSTWNAASAVQRMRGGVIG